MFCFSLKHRWPLDLQPSVNTNVDCIRPDAKTIGPDQDKNISCKCNHNKRPSCFVMPPKVYSGAVVGVEAYEVEIEVQIGRAHV